MCGISKNTFYNHKHRDDRFLEKYSNLRKKIEKIIKDNSFYGVVRIKAELEQKYNKHIGRDALGRLLKLWGLTLARKVKKTKPSIIKKILILLSNRSNLLIRTNIEKAFQAISSDISEIYYNNGKYKAYLCIHKDVLGQMVYGWKLAETMESKLVLDSFRMTQKIIKKLIKKIPEKLLCHQDQGSQYTSYEYVNTVLQSNMRLSYSTPGTPTDNPGQESFFGRLKDECQDDFNEAKDFRKLEKIIKKRIKYYNKKRLHRSLECKTPWRFTKQFI